MKLFSFALLTATTLLAGNSSQTFTGIVTDSMCLKDHAMMHMSPDSKCVRECAKTNPVKYVLYDGKTVYKLSDQQTPAEFAAKKVKVSGTLFPKTGIIQVDKIILVK